MYLWLIVCHAKKKFKINCLLLKWNTHAMSLHRTNPSVHFPVVSFCSSHTEAVTFRVNQRWINLPRSTLASSTSKSPSPSVSYATSLPTAATVHFNLSFHRELCIHHRQKWTKFNHRDYRLFKIIDIEEPLYFLCENTYSLTRHLKCDMSGWGEGVGFSHSQHFVSTCNCI